MGRGGGGGGLITEILWYTKPCSGRTYATHKTPVYDLTYHRASNQYLEGHEFNSHWGAQKIFFLSIQLENASSVAAIPCNYRLTIFYVYSISESAIKINSFLKSYSVHVPVSFFDINEHAACK